MQNRPRKSNRLRSYDYSQAGFYFVTVCTYKKTCYFGKISNDCMIHSKVGEIAAVCLEELPVHFPEVELDTFVVMPNHIHVVIFIKSDNVGDRHAYPLRGRPYQRLPVVMGSFKSAVTKEANRLQPDVGFKWQRSYYDHVIRSETSLERIRQYITYNPAKWEYDRENCNDVPLQQKKRFWHEFLHEVDSR